MKVIPVVFLLQEVMISLMLLNSETLGMTQCGLCVLPEQANTVAFISLPGHIFLKVLESLLIFWTEERVVLLPPKSLVETG